MISAIIVNWNTCEYLQRCLASIQETMPDLEKEVIVVDNASSDNSVAMVRQHFPQVRVIANEQNRGFSAGVNNGLDASCGEYVLIMNPDIVLRRGVMEELVRYLDGHPDVGAVVPSLRNPDGSEQAGYFRRPPTVTQLLLFSTLLAPWCSRRTSFVERYLETRRVGDASALEVEQIPGAFLLTTRSVIARVGRFDEDYRLFFEDVDWCARAHDRGLRLVMLPRLEVTHIGGRSFLVDDGTRVQARYFVSCVTYFAKRGQRAKAVAAAVIIGLNSFAVLAKNSIFQGGSDPGARRRASLSRRTHWNTLRLFFKALVLRQDEGPLP
jgi:hypothetical protein